MINLLTVRYNKGKWQAFVILPLTLHVVYVEATDRLDAVGALVNKLVGLKMADEVSILTIV